MAPMASFKVKIFALTFFFFPICSFGSWGLNPTFLVESCQSKAFGKCETFRGRSNQSNGSASLIIWKVGTKRIIAWGAATPEANNLIKDKLDFSQTLFADFTACPMEKDIPGHRIDYCIEAIKNLKWVKAE